LAEPIGIGIIGSGGIALDAHIPAILELADTELVALSNRSEAKAQRAAARAGIDEWYTDNQKVIDHPGVDAVVICTPPNAHKEWTLKAAAAGKHVLCEKPMALDLSECDEMIAACHAAGVQLMIPEMKRFNPGFRQARQLIADGVIGELYLARYHNSYFEPHTRQAWWVVPEISGGGELMNEFTHQVNVLRWMMGPVVQVSCLSNHPQGEPPEDNAAITLRFANQALAVVTISWMTKEYNLTFPAPLEHAWDERIEFFGTEGSLRIDTPFTYWRVPIQLAVYSDKGGAGLSRGWNFVRCAPSAHYVEQIRHFVQCIRGETECEVSGEQGRLDLQVVRAAMESADSGRIVNL
jgi:predicted dehydrogenase